MNALPGRIFMINVLGLVFSLPLLAEPLFPSSPLLDRKVRFWELMFTRYSSREAVVHDRDTPDLILGAINRSDPKRLEVFTAARMEAVKDFARLGSSARELSSLHARIWRLYSGESSAKSRLLSGRVRLRTQAGLSDTFRAAALRAQLYLPRMERIFEQEGVPKELTRLPFVESMFNIRARSKVGAVGLWQLMPEAARSHIIVRRRQDERVSPYRATMAAARILKSNYRGLKTWPLAVTAYNHGANGIKRGVKKTGSRRLGDLILSYRSPSFGFASQNFYASFLAAHQTYARWESAQNRSSLRHAGL